MSNHNIEQIKNILSIIEEQRYTLMNMREALSIVKFILKEPEIIQDNYDLLYGLKNILTDMYNDVDNLHNNLDLSIDFNKIIENS